MKTAIVYYTFGGATKKEADRFGKETDASVYQVTEEKKRSLLGAFLRGCPSAMKRKAVPIKPLGVNLSDFDKVIIGCPIWAGFPAPAFNSIVELLPAGKQVELFFCSGGGETPKSETETKELVKKKGCEVIAYLDIPTHAKPGKAKES